MNAELVTKIEALKVDEFLDVNGWLRVIRDRDTHSGRPVYIVEARRTKPTMLYGSVGSYSAKKAAANVRWFLNDRKY